jgi:hypothetical protein
MLKMIDILSGVRTRTLGAHIAGNILKGLLEFRFWYKNFLILATGPFLDLKVEFSTRITV